MEHRKITEQQWVELLNTLRNFIANNAFLEEKEFNSFANVCDFIFNNQSQFTRLPIKDYYTGMSLQRNFSDLHTTQSRFNEAPKIIQYMCDI